jgi:hypothetical protein
MVSELLFYQLGLIALVWLCFLLHGIWPSDAADVCPTTPTPPPSKRTRAPKPLAGLTHKPPCDACEHASEPRLQTPIAPPRLAMTRGRRRQVDTSSHFCPNPAGRYHGGVGWGNLRANGHPHGGPWRQLRCVAGRRYFLKTLGTIFHGKRTSVELIVRVIACLAAGLGIRGTARGFEVDSRPGIRDSVRTRSLFSREPFCFAHLRPIRQRPPSMVCFSHLNTISSLLIDLPFAW